jgi:hypothetical protein
LGRGQTMNDLALRRLAGVLLILTPIAFNLLFTLLSVTFEYPDILREPAGYVLEQFDAGGAGLVATWYGFMLTAVLFVPLVVLVHRVLAGDGREAGAPFYLGLATAFGVVAGVMQFLGLARWSFLVPYLADSYTDPASSEATRESVAVVFEAFNQYAGVAVGEHLGYLFTGLPISPGRSPVRTEDCSDPARHLVVREVADLNSSHVSYRVQRSRRETESRHVMLLRSLECFLVGFWRCWQTGLLVVRIAARRIASAHRSTQEREREAKERASSNQATPAHPASMVLHLDPPINVMLRDAVKSFCVSDRNHDTTIDQSGAPNSQGSEPGRANHRLPELVMAGVPRAARLSG